MKILIEESVLRQALEALEPHKSTVLRWITPVDSAITALRAAIEAAEKQEPVAWMGEYNINDIRDHYTVVMRHKTDFDGMPERVRPLYTPQQQPAIPAWQPIETPPKEWGSYLIWHPKYGMETLWFQLKDGGNDGRKAGNWYDEEGDDDYPCNARVTHWMPLPAAPKPENSHD